MNTVSGKLLWLPIAVAPLPDLSSIIDRQAGLSEFWMWRFHRLTEPRENSYMVSEWQSWVREHHPEVVHWFEQLPFKTLRNVKFNLQTAAVEGHVDFKHPLLAPDLWDNNHHNEPCGYRIVVRGRRDVLWVQRSDGSRQYTTLPEDTDTYVLDHTSGWHGVDHDDDRWTIFCHAEIDETAHRQLLRASLARYHQHAIYDSNNGEP